MGTRADGEIAEYNKWWSARLTGKSAMWLVETQLWARSVGDSSLVLSACLGGSQGYSWLTCSSQRERGAKCNCLIPSVL